ncbi:MAG: SDR family NAD(P)-dependent oxidoreductase [Pseudomonadota bacterium]
MARPLRIQNSVVLVTGGGKGIGLELLREVARRGGHPIAVEVDQALATSLSDEFGATGAVHQADVRDAEAMARIVEDTTARFGRLDVVIANAGIERIDPVWSMPNDVFEDVIEINVLGTYRTLKPAFEPVIRSGGHLLTIASIAALIPFPLGCAYGTSKAAVDMMMRIIRMELDGTGATAGAAYFGIVRTDMGDRVHNHPVVSATSKRLPTRLLGVTPTPTADRAAKAILDGVERRKARVYAPYMIRYTYFFRGVFGQFDGVNARMMKLSQEIRNAYGPPPGSG